MAPKNEFDRGNTIDVALLSEVIREFIPYRVMRASQQATLPELMAGEYPHASWYYDAWTISTAYHLLSSYDNVAAVETALLQLIFPENLDARTAPAR